MQGYLKNMGLPMLQRILKVRLQAEYTEHSLSSMAASAGGVNGSDGANGVNSNGASSNRVNGHGSYGSAAGDAVDLELLEGSAAVWEWAVEATHKRERLPTTTCAASFTPTASATTATAGKPPLSVGEATSSLASSSSADSSALSVHGHFVAPPGGGVLRLEWRVVDAEEQVASSRAGGWLRAATSSRGGGSGARGGVLRQRATVLAAGDSLLPLIEVIGPGLQLSPDRNGAEREQGTG